MLSAHAAWTKASWRTAKSCGPDPPTLGSSLRVTSSQITVANKPGTPRRPRISRKPSRRECRLIWLPCCCLRAQVHFLCTQGSRVRPAPGIPCALSFDRGVHFAKPRADHAAGTLIHVLHLLFDSQIGKVSPQCERPPEGGLSLKLKFGSADHRCVRARHGHRLAGLHDGSGLGVVDMAAGGDAERCHRDTGDQRHHHDLQMGRTIGGMNGVVHLSLPASETPCWAEGLRPNCFRVVSSVPPNGFVEEPN